MGAFWLQGIEWWHDGTERKFCKANGVEHQMPCFAYFSCLAVFGCFVVDVKHIL